MSTIFPNADGVRIRQNSTLKKVQFGETVTRGACVYRNTDGKYYLTLASSTPPGEATDPQAELAGIVVNENTTDKWGIIVATGDVDVGVASLVAGQPYILDDSLGRINTYDDINSNNILTHVGYAMNTTDIRVAPVNQIVFIAP